MTVVIREELITVSKTQRKRTKPLGRLSRCRASVRRRKYAAMDALLQPWFLSKATAHAVLRLIPLEYISRMRWHFEDYGCLGCKRKKVLYSANGLCVDCRLMIGKQLVQSMKRRVKAPASTEPLEPNRGYLNRIAAAEELLGQFVQKKSRGSISVSVLAREPQIP